MEPQAQARAHDRLPARTAPRRGPLALVLGRFVPIVRTCMPVAAGTAGMSYRSFVGWNVTGAEDGGLTGAA
ncbi:DedA protein [Micrococcus lylae]|uniref:DedA protein n=1 Tax=Micrococcus lylae TaxID=1273 RepID=A0A1R4JND2_9MICC|nr:DedA protein [Micrococcus lylae]